MKRFGLQVIIQVIDHGQWISPERKEVLNYNEYGEPSYEASYDKNGKFRGRVGISISEWLSHVKEMNGDSERD